MRTVTPPPGRANLRLMVWCLTRSNSQIVGGEWGLWDADWSSPEWSTLAKFELWVHEIDLDLRVLETRFAVLPKTEPLGQSACLRMQSPRDETCG